MPTYLYRAKRGPDQAVEGEVMADSRAAAVARLDAMGYSPIWVRESTGARTESVHPRAGGRVSGRDITVFTYQLASLIRAGVPILRSLSTVAEQTDSRGLGAVAEAIRKRVQDGCMLSEAIEVYPRLFSPLYVSMVRAGESAGLLDTVLLRLAESREKEDAIRRSVQTALAYPALITAVGIATVLFLLGFFLPRVATLFRDFRDLPVPTRILLGISNGLQEAWPWLLVVSLLAVAVIHRLVLFEKGRLALDGLKLRLPLLGRFLLHADIARFARTLGLLLEAGVAIDRAMLLSAAVLRNRVLGQAAEQARSLTVQQGLSFASSIRRTGVFPPLVANMAGVGEEAGRLDAALAELAQYYERDCDQRSRVATSLIEPVLILLVGGMVGFIVAAMLLPVFRLTSGL
jgi:type II secretory pathway component PulF